MDPDESRRRACRTGDAPQRQTATKGVIDRQAHSMAIARHGGTRLMFGWGADQLVRRQPSNGAAATPTQ
jgi:hypothetical protein